MPAVALVEHRSLTTADFAEMYLAHHQPVVIRSGISHWAAIGRWSSSYLKATAVGSKFRVLSKSDYGDSGSKRLSEAVEELDVAEILDMMELEDAPDMSYVRQADAWATNPKLLADIEELEYGKPHVRKENGKLWVGPRGTVAQMHWDPAHNLVAQIRGEKHWILSSPSESHLTYPNKFCLSTVAQDPGFRAAFSTFAERLDGVASSGKTIEEAVDEMSDVERKAIYGWLSEFNNCDVNVENPDPMRTPLFGETTRYYATLHPGDLIFVPYAWRHYVRSLSPSISLNWFFSPQGELPPDVDMKRTILEHIVAAT